MNVCGAKTRGGGTCKRAPAKGRNRCKLHGGASPRGPASPHYKHGRCSKVGPLAQAAQRVAEQSDLLDLRPGVALFDVRIEEIAERLEEKDTPALRVKVLKLVKEAIEDPTKAPDLLKKAEALLQAGAERDATWAKLLEHQERRSERAERAQDRWLKQSQVYHLAELQAAVNTMIEVLAERLPRETVVEVAQALEVRLLGPSGSKP